LRKIEEMSKRKGDEKDIDRKRFTLSLKGNINLQNNFGN
jgi:hypothetical protein